VPNFGTIGLSMIRDQIIKSIANATKLDAGELRLETPEIIEHGDYASNVAMVLAKKNGTDPRTVALEIVDKLRKDSDLEKIIKKIDIAGPGFINFYLSRAALERCIDSIHKDADKYGSSKLHKDKKYLIEHTSPNTVKTLHVGHVRNNTLGMAMHNLLAFAGADVTLDAINNDRGIHVMKAVWAYMKYGKGKTPDSEKVKPDHFVDHYYVLGTKKERVKGVKAEMQTLLKKWEANDKEVVEVWKKLRDWTFDGFKLTYKRLGSCHDKQWFESDFWEKGKETVELGLKKGVFKRLPDGAVLSNLKNYGLTDTVVLRADGTTMYHTQDLYLTQLKRKEFPSDLYIWDVGPEQTLYLRQLFAMLDQLRVGELKNYFHLAYGFIFLKGKGKMSSREGTVVSADWLMDEVVKKAEQLMDESETEKKLTKNEKKKISESVGLGAIKYGLLKVSRLKDIQFDIDESLSLEGDSGPYIQYTYARCKSVLRKSQITNSKLQTNLKSQIPNYKVSKEENELMRTFIHFPEVVDMAAENCAPNYICTYLFDLAQKFNTFYNKHSILDPEVDAQRQSLSVDAEVDIDIDKDMVDNIKNFRLALTSGAAQILSNGLNLLGIEAPERM
jgi:arginyl-tRNA synthetase